MPRLVVEHLAARHGLLAAVSDVSFHLDPGEVVALVGANGAGKTTLLRTIAGAHPASGGRIVLDGIDLAGIPPHRRVGLGLALVPEGRRLFAAMSVEDNLRLARSAGRSGPWTMAAILAAFPQLAPLRRARAGTLSGGNQQKLVIGKWLHRRPRVLLLDEPTRGIDIGAKQEIFRTMRHLTKGKMAVVLVSSDLEEIVEHADTVLGMARGAQIALLEGAEASEERILKLIFAVEGRPNQ